MLPEAATFEAVTSDALPETITAAYEGLDEAGKTVGYVFTAKGRGFDGDITVMAAIEPGGTILHVATIDVTSETKTLGGQTASESYTSQYAGQDASLAGGGRHFRGHHHLGGLRGLYLDCFAAFDAVERGLGRETIEAVHHHPGALIKENPVLVLVLGTCPTLAISTSVSAAIGMGLAATAVLICSNVAISALRKTIPEQVRIPCYIVLIAGFVSVVSMILEATPTASMSPWASTSR